MCFFDDTFNVTREFFDETLDLIIDDIRPILLSPDEFKLVPVPFYKPKVYEDKDAGRRYETYTEVEYNTRRRFDIVLENSGIGHIQIYYCRPDQVHVTITKHRKIKERFPSEKIDRPAQEHLLDRLVEELCRIEPGHNRRSMQKVEIAQEPPKPIEHDEEILLYKTAKKFGIRRFRLERWRKIYPLLGELTQEQLAERCRFSVETIKKDLKAIRKSGYKGD